MRKSSSKAAGPSIPRRIQMEAEAIGGRLQESWNIRCVPESAQVERILVQLSEKARRRRDGKWPARRAWTLTARQLVERGSGGIRPEQCRGNLGNHLEPPAKLRLSNCRVRARRPLRSRARSALASLPEASRQNGTLVIRRTAKSGIRIENRRLKCLPPEPPSLESFPTAWATFSYDPARDAAPSNEPPLMLAPDGRQLSSACAWSVLLESWHEPSGVSRYAAVWELQLGDREQARITLPGRSRSVRGERRLDRRSACRLATDSRNQRHGGKRESEQFFGVASGGKAFCDAGRRICRARQTAWSDGHDRLAICRASICRCFRPGWRMWLPSGYEAVDGQSPGLPLFAPRATIGKRLWGPLGRDANERRFRIFSAEDWAAIAGDPRAGALPAKFGKDRGHSERFARQRRIRRRKSSLISWRDILASEFGEVECCRGCSSIAWPWIGWEFPAKLRLPAVAGNDAANRVEELLQKSRLALLVSGDSVLLTSQISAALYSRQWSSHGVVGGGNHLARSAWPIV